MATLFGRFHIPFTSRAVSLKEENASPTEGNASLSLEEPVPQSPIPDAESREEITHNLEGLTKNQLLGAVRIGIIDTRKTVDDEDGKQPYTALLNDINSRQNDITVENVRDIIINAKGELAKNYDNQLKPLIDERRVQLEEQAQEQKFKSDLHEAAREGRHEDALEMVVDNYNKLDVRLSNGEEKISERQQQAINELSSRIQSMPLRDRRAIYQHYETKENDPKTQSHQLQVFRYNTKESLKDVLLGDKQGLSDEQWGQLINEAFSSVILNKKQFDKVKISLQSFANEPDTLLPEKRILQPGELNDFMSRIGPEPLVAYEKEPGEFINESVSYFGVKDARAYDDLSEKRTKAQKEIHSYLYPEQYLREKSFSTITLEQRKELEEKAAKIDLKPDNEITERERKLLDVMLLGREYDAIHNSQQEIEGVQKYHRADRIQHVEPLNEQLKNQEFEETTKEMEKVINGDDKLIKNDNEAIKGDEEVIEVGKSLKPKKRAGFSGEVVIVKGSYSLDNKEAASFQIEDIRDEDSKTPYKKESELRKPLKMQTLESFIENTYYDAAREVLASPQNINPSLKGDRMNRVINAIASNMVQHYPTMSDNEKENYEEDLKEIFKNNMKESSRNIGQVHVNEKKLLKAVAQHNTNFNELARFEKVVDGNDKFKAFANERGFTDLHKAAYSGNHRAVTAMIARGDDINAQSKEEGTALHYAIRSANKDMSNLNISDEQKSSIAKTYLIMIKQIRAQKPKIGFRQCCKDLEIDPKKLSNQLKQSKSDDKSDAKDKPKGEGDHVKNLKGKNSSIYRN
ncbi:MAG: ankyrin repeat domain-containing protein [Alphaproteobacteria bacterium]|nr:ankyrin repeat domain-containing protein [Alphaproteobacteria bacterium]